MTHESTFSTALLAVACDASKPQAIALAEVLAHRLHVPLSSPDTHNYPLLLIVTDTRIEVRQTDSTSGPVYCEFISGPFGYRKASSLRHELLARAIGFKDVPLNVIDATAGLGRDAMVLALLGCRVTAIEFHPIVFELLEDGLRRVRLDPDMARRIEGRLHLVSGDAVDRLAALPRDTPPDAVYLDPMFPARTNSSLSKKEMVLLRRLLGESTDADALRLLGAALATGCRRVVMKRPKHAPQLTIPGSPPPSLHLEGRAARFDVYFPAGAVQE